MVRGTDVPDLIPADNTAYQLYMDSLTDRQVFVDPEMAELGFITAKFRTADVLLDGGVGGAIPANSMYFLDTDFFHYRPMEGMDVYQLGTDREPTNQDAMIRLIGWKGNLTLSASNQHAYMRTD